MKASHFLILALAASASAIQAGAQEQPAAALPDPLDIKGAILYALDHNYDIQQAREQIRLQEGIVMQARAPSIPNVGATGSYQRNAAAISTTFPIETSQWLAELKATQELFAGGGIRSAVRSAVLNRDAAMLDLQATVNASLLDVRSKFYAVLLDREKVRVQEENVELFRRQLKDAKSQFSAGSVSNFEVLRAEVSLANAQPDLITARNDYRIAIEQLRQALGVPPSATAPFPQVAGELTVSQDSYELESALATAHAQRPELLSLAKQEESGEESVTTARSNYYPNVSAFGGLETGGIGEPGGAHINASGWLFGAQATWSIFDGRATAGRVRQAHSQLEQAHLTRAQEELAVDVEVRQALSSLQEANELVAASQKTVEQAKEALRLANSRYHAGTATQLDVLTSQVSLTQARTNQLQANYTCLIAAANMRKAIGLGDALVGQ
jgi:outer membrane protein